MKRKSEEPERKEKKQKREKREDREVKEKGKKRKKRNDDELDNAVLPSERETTGGDKGEIQSRITQLEQLTQDIIKSPSTIREYIGEGGLDIVNAAAELGRAFAHAKLSPRPQQSKSPASNTSLRQPPPIKDKSLEKAVFTHQGSVHIQQKALPGESSYDRLEILGDAYLEVIATRLIWDRFTTLPPGRLSQIREILVKNETLAEYSVEFGFDKRVNINPDVKDQPKRWTKVKGDIFEAYVAAVILSNPTNGFDLVESWLTELWVPKLASIQPHGQAVHYKEDLAKKVMGKGIRLRYIDESPPIQHEGGMKTFFVGVYITGWGWTDQHLGSGSGLNKVVAGNTAAKEAFEKNGPLVDQIHAVKKEFDDKVKAEREKALLDS